MMVLRLPFEWLAIGRCQQPAAGNGGGTDASCPALLSLRYLLPTPSACCDPPPGAQLFEDTVARGKPIVFLYGKRPFSGGTCLGVEQALATMRAGVRQGALRGWRYQLLIFCLGVAGPSAAALLRRGAAH